VSSPLPGLLFRAKAVYAKILPPRGEDGPLLPSRTSSFYIVNITRSGRLWDPPKPELYPDPAGRRFL